MRKAVLDVSHKFYHLQFTSLWNIALCQSQIQNKKNLLCARPVLEAGSWFRCRIKLHVIRSRRTDLICDSTGLDDLDVEVLCSGWSLWLRVNDVLVQPGLTVQSSAQAGMLCWSSPVFLGLRSQNFFIAGRVWPQDGEKQKEPEKLRSCQMQWMYNVFHAVFCSHLFLLLHVFPFC